jgi:hypothetical protein
MQQEVVVTCQSHALMPSIGILVAAHKGFLEGKEPGKDIHADAEDLEAVMSSGSPGSRLRPPESSHSAVALAHGRKELLRRLHIAWGHGSA